MQKILIVEDDTNINNLLREALSKEGYSCEQAFSGTEAKLLLNMQEHGYELVLLDLMLPGIPGEAVLEEIRKKGNLPVIVLTAKDSLDEKVEVLTSGADDYITKPFNLLELIARVKSNLRRYVTLGNYDNNFNKDILKSGGLELNISTKEVKVDGEVVKITPIEFKILKLLLSNKGRVFSIDEIYEKVWNEESFNVENTVAVHIRRIREKIEINPKEPRYLKVVWGVGYKIEKL